MPRRLETEDEVLDLAEDLYKFMEENPETDKHDDGEEDSMSAGEGEGEKGDEDSNWMMLVMIAYILLSNLMVMILILG